MIFKHWKLLIIFVISIFLIYKCTPESKINYSDKLIPIGWLNEDTFLFGNREDIFLSHKNDSKLKIFSTPIENNELDFYSFCIDEETWTSGIYNVTRNGSAIISANLGMAYGRIYEDSNGKVIIVQKGIISIFSKNDSGYNMGKCWRELTEYIKDADIEISMVDGIYTKNFDSSEMHLRNLSTKDSKAFGQNHFDKVFMFITDLKNGVIFRKGKTQFVINLPNKGITARHSLFISYSSLKNEYFVYQEGCAYKSPSNLCSRLGWWINTDFEVTETVVFPNENLLEVEESLSCFSCGCGCYTNEEIIINNGSVYAHIWGFPIPLKRRGLYKLTKDETGKYNWNHLVEGRLEAPIKFSPSGCKLIYFKVALLDDKLEITNIC